MAFCSNCGHQVADGVKFCENCGAPLNVNDNKHNAYTGAANIQENAAAEDNWAYDEVREPDNWDKNAQKNVHNSRPRDVQFDQSVNQMDSDSSKLGRLDKYGKFYGIILFALACVDYVSDPAILTIILSLVIISGCVFCFSRKYKLKAFTIIALIIAVICLLCGIGQAKKYGLLSTDASIEAASAKEAAAEISEADDTDDRDIAVNAIDKTTSADSDKTADKTAGDKKSDVSKAENKKTDSSANKDKSSKSDENSQDQSKNANGVDPDLKAILDEYETFMNDYVDFMKSYNSDSTNALTMMGDYLELLDKYQKLGEVVDSYDPDEMSVEDAKYYLDVVNRCNQKMLELY